MNNSFAEDVFKKEFYGRMLTPGNPRNPIRNRADSLYEVFKLLDQRTANTGQSFYNILETGTTRPDHGHLCFGDDGCATYIFDRFINYYDGELLSVDIDEKNCQYARSLVSVKTKVACSDSVRFLWNLPTSYKVDVLYLDSYDITRDNPHPSQLHHLKEMCAVIKNLKEGSIVIIDDHDAFLNGGIIGKGTYVKDFMDNINATKIFEGYQIGWCLTDGNNLT